MKSAAFYLLLIPVFLSPLLTTAEEHSHKEATPPTTILITGSLSPQGMARIGKPLSSVSGKKLSQATEASIGDTLSRLPGVSSSSFGPGASRPILRGLGKERVRVIENGLENGDASASSDDHAVTLDPLTTERIEILRGPSTLMYGSQAIGGVVNVIDESIQEERVGKAFTGKATFTGGDEASDELSGGAVLQGEAGPINWYASGFVKDTNDIRIPGSAESSLLHEQEEEHEHHEDEEEHEEEEHHEDEEENQTGRLENSDTESYGFKTGLSHVFENGFFGLAVRHNGSEYGIPGGHAHHHEEEEHEHEEEGDHEHEEGETPVRIDMEQTRVETRGAVHLHEGFLDTARFGFSYSDYEHKELEGSEVGTTYKRDSLETRVLLTHHHTDMLEGGVGFQLNYDDFSVKGDEAFVPSNETLLPALFVIEDFAINNDWVWQLGGRYEHANINPEFMSSKSFDAISASTGLIWKPGESPYSAAANLSYSERAPNAAELFAEGAHIASQIYERGDSSLDTESSVSGEIIFRKHKGSVRGSFTGFIQEFDNYINLQPQGVEIEEFPLFAYQGINARFWGFESELKVDLPSVAQHNFTLTSGIDYVRAQDTDTDRSLPRITPVRTSVGLEHSYNEFASYIEAQFVEPQTDVAEFELVTSGYVLLRAGASYTLPLDEYEVDFFIKGTNLFNEEARVHTSFLKDQAPLRGRAFYTGFTFFF